jgi:hypothetical protein
LLEARGEGTRGLVIFLDPLQDLGDAGPIFDECGFNFIAAPTSCSMLSI